MSITVKAEVSGGTDIKDACKEAVSLADRIGVAVTFTFNTVTCIAKPGASHAYLAELWRKELDSNHRYKVVCAQPEENSNAD